MLLKHRHGSFSVFTILAVSVVTASRAAIPPLSKGCDYDDRDGFVFITCPGVAAELQLSDGDTILPALRCPYADTYYNYQSTYGFVDFVGAVCPKDPSFYQACPDIFLDNFPDVPPHFLCGDNAYMCDQDRKDVFISGRDADLYMRCDGVMQCSNTDLDERGCTEYKKQERFECSFDRSQINAEEVCDGQCSCLDCADERTCRGFTYGMMCNLTTFTNVTRDRYIRPALLCNKVNNCDNWEDEQGCNMAVNTWIPGDPLPGTTYNLSHISLPSTSRCFPEPQVRYWYLDQVNCSDETVVGLVCRVGGFWTTVSVYVVCSRRDFELPAPWEGICDEGVDLHCKYSSTHCYTHKYRQCDGIQDCEDGTDEDVPHCRALVRRSCNMTAYRGVGLQLRQLPFAWILDGEEDCIGGVDEQIDAWFTCGKGVNLRLDFTRNTMGGVDTCSSMFICPGPIPKFIGLAQLCDDTVHCEIESAVCRASKHLEILLTRVSSQRDTSRTLSRISIPTYHVAHCLPGLHHLERTALGGCTVAPFPPQSEILGVTLPRVSFPFHITSCNYTFGEAYVHLSCLDKCPGSHCPLTPPVLPYNGCPFNFPVQNRIFSLVNNRNLTFVRRLSRHKYGFLGYFQCRNLNCIPYEKVCDLVDNCQDGSDEEVCTNHYTCSNKQLIPTHKFCDGRFDCIGLDDECNTICTKEILGSKLIKVLTFIMGVMGSLLNTFEVIQTVSVLHKQKTIDGLLNRLLILVIGIGDLLVGCYLIIIMAMDAKHGKMFCKYQNIWLSSVLCDILGVVNTVGSQLSLFSMTALSLLRVVSVTTGISGLSARRLTSARYIRANALVLFLVCLAVAIAVIPILDIFSEQFVNGVHYRNLPLFPGLANKVDHLAVVEAYYGQVKATHLQWNTLIKLIKDMFTNDYGHIEYRKLKFYGNSPACIFKFFVTVDDPQKVFTWIVIGINCVCFVVIACSYVIINTVSRRSSTDLIQGPNRRMILKRNQRLKKKISIIIASDFTCWVPFIVICIAHSLEIVNAVQSYTIFAVVILPINSVINPLLYNETIVPALTSAKDRLVWHILQRLEALREEMRAPTSLPQGNDGSGTTEDGVGTVGDGVGTVEDGVGTVEDGVGTVEDGVGTVEDGVGIVGDIEGTVEDGVGIVEDGVWTIGDGVGTVEDGVGTVGDGVGIVGDGEMERAGLMVGEAV